MIYGVICLTESKCTLSAKSVLKREKIGGGVKRAGEEAEGVVHIPIVAKWHFRLATTRARLENKLDDAKYGAFEHVPQNVLVVKVFKMKFSLQIFFLM